MAAADMREASPRGDMMPNLLGSLTRQIRTASLSMTLRRKLSFQIVCGLDLQP